MHSSVQLHCTMLFSTGYCSIHLHDLLVVHYTGNRQSTIYSICEVISSSMASIGNNKCAVVGVQYMECLCISYCSVYG